MDAHSSPSAAMAAHRPAAPRNSMSEQVADTAARRDVDVGDLINSRPLGFRQTMTLALCLLVVLLDGFDNQAIALLLSAMSHDLHIPLGRFGPVFGMAAIGMIASAIIIGPLADRFGRKRMLVGSTLCFGVGSLFTAYVHTLPELLTMRFVTGIGLGGVLPTVIAIAAEFSPKRLARTCIAVMVAGLPAGAMLGALTAPTLLHTHGWQATYYLGGAAPVIVAIAVAVWMPESVRHLIAHGAPPARIAKVVRLIAPDINTDSVNLVSRDALVDQPRDGQRIGAREIFTGGRAWATIFLWVPYFTNMMVVYFSISWLPSVIVASGRSSSLSTAATAAFAFGGILGSLGQGPLMNRLGPAPVLITQCGLAALYAFLLGTTHPGAIVIIVATAIAGCALLGVQAGLNALAAETYPTSIRATGAGWALGAGRLGSIAGPLLGGAMMAAQWDTQQIFQATAVPSLIAVAAIYFGRRNQRKRQMKRFCEE
ncbi:sugar (and other) transporter family protein [Burkholderia gladioli]|nr:sugar (and other) transporter family protein [Burkholderia gladioli]KGC11563.1 sugar (and other) transporter family protein [Burkholderia gladioli]